MRYYVDMKRTGRTSPRREAIGELALYKAILTLKTSEECRAFFRDLCTPAELQSLADRWATVSFLEQEIPYREIHKRTGVSVTTIGRVARSLQFGNGGYPIASERTKRDARCG